MDGQVAGEDGPIDPTLVRRARSASGALCLVALVVGTFALSQEWPRSALGWGAAGLFAVTLAFNRAYDRSLFRKTRGLADGAIDVSDLAYAEAIAMADRFESRLDWKVIDCLLDGAVDPQMIRMRARERIQARTRTLERDVQIDFSLHPKLSGSQYVPIIRFQKGELQDFRTLTNSDGSLASVLTYRESSALYLAVLRWCMLGAGACTVEAGRKPTTIYELYSSDLEAQIARAIVSRAARKSQTEPQREEADRAIGRLMGLGTRAEFPSMVEWGAALADMLTEHYMIVGRLHVDSGSTIARFQDLILPQPERIGATKVAGIAGSSLSLANRLRWVADRMRVAVGSRSSRITVSAQLARNSRSYHLEVIGPEGTFVSRQTIANYSRTDLRGRGVYDRWRGRHGQRYAHLYMRGASGLPAAPAVRIGFMERPPGSIGLATLGAFAAFFLWCAWARHPLEQEDARVGLAGMFLVFPAGLAAWVGFTVQRNVYGVPATTQLVNLLTICTSLAGCYAALVDERGACQLFVPASGIVLAMASYWWFGRFRVYSDCLAKALAPESP